MSRSFKVVLCGESGCGKTSIVRREIEGDYKKNVEATIAASFFQKSVQTKNGSGKLDIWDTAGQEKFRALTPMYYRDADAAIIVYDITKRDSFLKVKEWIKDITNSETQPNLVVSLVGNKKDLIRLRKVSTGEGQFFSEQNGLIFHETSAKTGEGINDVFQKCAEKLLTKKKKPNEDVEVEKIFPTQTTNDNECKC